MSLLFSVVKTVHSQSVDLLCSFSCIHPFCGFEKIFHSSRYSFSLFYDGVIGLDQLWAQYFVWISLQEELSFETNKTQLLLILYFIRKWNICNYMYAFFYYLLVNKEFFFELNFRKYNKVLSWWNVETELNLFWSWCVLPSC